MGKDDLQGDRTNFPLGSCLQINRERDFITRQPDDGADRDMGRLLGQAFSVDEANCKKKEDQEKSIVHFTGYPNRFSILFHMSDVL